MLIQHVYPFTDIGVYSSWSLASCFPPSSRNWRLTSSPWSGSALQVIAYAVDATAPPFPVLCLAYAVNGVGMSLQVRYILFTRISAPPAYISSCMRIYSLGCLQDAQTNGYVASLTENQEAKMGMLHAAYGACTLPLLQTATTPCS